MIHIIGTAHISKDSVKEVGEKIAQLRPDLVAVELCEARYRGLTEERDIPVLELLSKNSTTLTINVILSLLQRRMGDEVGVRPGEEMLAAVDSATRAGSQVAFIDRDIRITLKRAMARLGFFEKMRVVKELLASSRVTVEDLEEEINHLKEDEHVADVLEEFARISPKLYEILVRERDAYMAHNLLDLQEKYENIVVVVGAGHKKGIEDYMAHPEQLPDKASLLEVPKKWVSLTGVLKYGIPAFIIAMFLLAFYNGLSLKEPLGLWIVVNGVPTFVMVLLAGGHLVSALVGMVASPLTSLNPMMAAGWFAGAAELKVRNVTVNDISDMFKTADYRELYRNNAFRVLLVTALANVGSMLGTFSFIAYYITDFWYLIKDLVL
ncbi:MAG: TraB/GumN family protein [Deltaproteobacteria bacterium]|nr:TraB/GumN family protein [Deltaproteobacteria bacterium]